MSHEASENGRLRSIEAGIKNREGSARSQSAIPPVLPRASGAEPSALGANLSTAFGFAVGSNLINDLPVGLIGANALHASAMSKQLASAMLIGIDLGPNLSVTGSLATILWLIALRREKLEVSSLELF
jgi:Na+/H+ antiporter NhaD/arsenite permease-like protein